jgi:hypothetical protein
MANKKVYNRNKDFTGEDFGDALGRFTDSESNLIFTMAMMGGLGGGGAAAGTAKAAGEEALTAREMAEGEAMAAADPYKKKLQMIASRNLFGDGGRI